MNGNDGGPAGGFESRMLALITEGVPARFRKAAITPELRLQRDLGLDSIALLALMFRFEKEFGIDLSRLDVGVSIGRMRTVGDALHLARAIIDQNGTRQGDPS